MKNFDKTLASLILIGITIFMAAQIGFFLYKPEMISKIPFAELNIIGGDIQVQARDSLAWETAKDGMSLEPGDRIRTRVDSRGFITFSQGTTTKLEPGTDLIIADFQKDSDDKPNKIALEQKSGKTWTQVTERADGESYFQVKTSSADIKVHGTLFALEVDKGGETTVRTTQGDVSVNARGVEVHVPGGQQTTVEPGNSPSFPTPIPPAKNELVFTIDNDSAGLIIAPSGSKTGYLTDRQAVNQISGSQISPADDAIQTIRIPEPETGEYKVVMQGTTGEILSYKVDGFTDGQNTFSHSQSDNASSLNETVLKLHIDVIDGLLKEVPGLNLMSEVKVTETTKLSGATAEDNKQTGTPDKSAENAGINNNGFQLGRGYSFSNWIVVVSIIVVLGVAAVFIWRKI